MYYHDKTDPRIDGNPNVRTGLCMQIVYHVSVDLLDIFYKMSAQ